MSTRTSPFLNICECWCVLQIPRAPVPGLLQILKPTGAQVLPVKSRVESAHVSIILDFPQTLIEDVNSWYTDLFRG